MSAHAWWQLYVTLVAAISMVLLMATAATHLHKTALAAEDCALCCNVIDKIADLTVPPAVAMTAPVLLPYRLLTLAPLALVFSSNVMLPPSCGPPASV
ncbi:hypothetical protein [Janthinobacterium agaricidamnosum]|uniref:Transmembrane protein n=1 Tax=Janthinobacterium agaricidamnosum NBRC 102515 = DSM 9628 TaxID=1349767 RepID=W0VDQ8_9BURK|nr:hypothetical protein [Janthinobacterium agaricidamnosum]CDG86056.1 hypothetical protein GJA_5460 [Janthinobacterium agaricidamnosum NBRC 102515 = DSM 9628]